MNQPHTMNMIFDKKSELNVLINLAASDSNVASRESKLIHTIGTANGISKEDIDNLLKSPSPIGGIDTLTEDEKFEHLYHLIQLMKMDGQVFRSEIVFCEHIAEKLGFKKGVVAEISQHVYSDPTITADREMVKSKAMKFLKGN
ncbi:MAG: TerB family tellurite resistance protein [Chryseolinea sp.]